MNVNRLYLGDNLLVLATIPDASIDLIYLDPPFNSNRNYCVNGSRKVAFEDTWHWTRESARTLEQLKFKHGELAELLDLIVRQFGHNDLSAYLVMMAIRLVELHRVLKLTGSLYLHCDPTASHYLKMMLDIVFGARNFRNELIWKRTSAHSSAKRYGSVHDVILFYTKSNEFTWNVQYTQYEKEYIEAFFDSVDENGCRYKRVDLTGAGVSKGLSGQPWRGIDVTAKGRHWAYVPKMLEKLDTEGRIHWPAKVGGMPRLKQYPEDLSGIPLQDTWVDISPLHNLSNERLGYPTQKPVALLERIVQASSNLGDIVLDPFCGCGTAVHASQKLGRQWIGIDITHLAIALIEKRLKDAFPGIQFTVGHQEPCSKHEPLPVCRNLPK